MSASQLPPCVPLSDDIEAEKGRKHSVSRGNKFAALTEPKLRVVSRCTVSHDVTVGLHHFAANHTIRCVAHGFALLSHCTDFSLPRQKHERECKEDVKTGNCRPDLLFLTGRISTVGVKKKKIGQIIADWDTFHRSRPKRVDGRCVWVEKTSSEFLSSE